MEKRNWLWKRKSSDKSPGETESSESISSHSERYSDEQDGSRALPNDNTHSPEVTSKATLGFNENGDTVKILTEKLSAALVNVSAKEDLVKQHAKVAEEAVAGWEKAEKEVVHLKQQLDAVMQKNFALEDRGNHLDGALKECVRQLRQGREDQEQKIVEAVLDKTHEWESMKINLEAQLEHLKKENSALKQKQTESPTADPNLLMKLEFLESENSALKLEIRSRFEELEIMTIERDLSAQAAENASKQHLEGIKKVAKLEAECRRLQVMNRKSSLSHDQKSVSTSSNYVESFTDSQSDSGERSTLISEIDQLKNEKSLRGSIAGSPLEIDIMDDFLEMERLVALPESESKDKRQKPETNSEKNQLKNDYEAMSNQVFELEEKVKKIEAEKNELKEALASSRSSYLESQFQLKGAQMSIQALEKELDGVNESNKLLELQLKGAESRLEALQKELDGVNEAKESVDFQLKGSELRLEALQKELVGVNESKELVEFQLIAIEAEARTMSSKVDSLKEEIEKEKSLSAEMAVKCRELQDELASKSQEIELQQAIMVNDKAKIEQEELDVAAGKLAECQKTIASLGRQLQSLATLEDFLIDTANLPGFSGDSELWKLQPNESIISKNNSNQTNVPVENSGPLLNGNNDEKSPVSSSSLTSSKNRNGFGKLFTRSKSGVQLENQQS